jgi:RND family efflux transporter MFP subunit
MRPLFRRQSTEVAIFCFLRRSTVSQIVKSRRALSVFLCAAASLFAGCKSAPPPPPPPQAMPVQVSPVTFSPVPSSDTYVATIKSRRSSTMQPQVDGNITKIFVKSGDVVKTGQVLMRIDPLRQKAAVESQQGTQSQKKAVYDYSQIELERQRKLFEAGVVSRDAFDQATQAFQNAKGDYEANAALTDTQKQQLAYYDIRAPFDGVVGDIPVHLGDYVSSTTLLTTVDENADLEAYIYVPTERAGNVRVGLPVEVLDTVGNILVKSRIDFLSPQVDNGLQSILAKADIPRTAQRLRNQQMVKARVTWSTSPTPVVPILAVSIIGGQSFVYVATPQGEGYIAHQVAVNLGETVGNTYPVISGLKEGDKVIISGLQFLQEGAPVKPLG